MAGINKAIIVGNIGQMKTFNSSTGNVVMSFSMATSSKYKDKQGNQVESTEWHNMVAYGKTAELLQMYGGVGKKLYAEGYLKTEKYNKDGIDRYTTKIVVQTIQFLSKKDEEGGADVAAQSNDYSRKEDVPFDDDIPF